jgi:TonB family protein
MNGRQSAAVAAAGPRLPRQKPWSENADAALLRLLAAFALSCLLHAAVFFLPYLGLSSTQPRSALAGGRKPPLVLNATLDSAGERRQSDSVADRVLSAEPVPRPPFAHRDAAPVAQPAAQERAEGADLLPLAAPAYYSTDQLTKRPQPLTVADLDAPQIRPIVASGKIVLKLWINEFGAVADIRVEKTELPEVFSRSAVAAFKGMRFAPGERNGQPVGTVMRIEVNYDDGRGKPD